MADFSGTTQVNASAQALFDYLSAVSHLPRYFARMTSARSGQGQEVHTTATLPDGQQVEGDAEVQQGVDQTLATIKHLVEQQATP